MKLTKAIVDKIPLGETDKTYWDDDVTGLGVRVRNQTKSWIVMYRNSYGVLRKLTIGRTDRMDPDDARKLAREKLVEVDKGKDPANAKQEARKAMTVNELCDLYIEEGMTHKKPSTIQIDLGRINRHIRPLIGKTRLQGLSREIIEKMMLDIIKGNIPAGDCKRILGGKTAAKRTMDTFAAMLEFAKGRGIIDVNPAQGIKKPKTNKKEVYLGLGDIRLLGNALRKAEDQGEDKTILNAIKMLVLTGCRRNEVISLPWAWVDLDNQCFRFEDTKTGKQTRPFGKGALNLLLDLQKSRGAGVKWVFPSKITNGSIIGIPKVFKRVLGYVKDEDMKAKDITLHTLRHSFASVAANMGFSELTIAGLLGHRLGGVTNRYSHLPDKSLIVAADAVSLEIEKALQSSK